jgi:hypothetical protein
VHFEIFIALSEVAANVLVIRPVEHFSEQVEAVELMENLQPDSVALHACLWIHGSQVVFRHADNFTLSIRDDLVSD